MTEEPAWGIRRDAIGIHALGQLERSDGAVAGRSLTEPQRRPGERAHAARPQRGARRRLRDRLRRPQPDVDLALHRHGPAGRVVPRAARAAGRRRRARALPDGRTGPQHRRAGRGEPRLEAGPGGQGDIAREPARHLPRRAAPGRLPACCATRWRRSRCCARTTAPRPCARSCPSSSAWTSRASAIAAMMSGSRHPLRPRRGTSAARAPHARSRPGHRRRPAARLRAAARCPAGAAQPRRARRLRHRARGRIASSSSTPRTTARGSCRCSGRSPLPPPC